MEDVAKMLGKSKRWLQDFLRGRPIGRMAGRTRLFTQADLNRVIALLPEASGSIQSD
jgi:hypothetical protein